MTIQNTDGFVVKKNMADFDELKDLQNKFTRQLQVYNQSVKHLIDESRDYISASNIENNQFANTYLKDPTGDVGYVTERGVWKRIPNPQTGDSMQGKNGCPLDWANAPIVLPDDGPSVSLANIKQGDMVKVGGEQLIRGTSVTMNQSCTSAGRNLYVTNPNETTGQKFVQCSQSPGAYQTDLGNTTIESCAKRAQDMGSNVFQLGQNRGGGKSGCYIGGGGRARNSGDCPNVPGAGRMGKTVSGRWSRSGSWWWGYNWSWIPGYDAYATYETRGANNSDVGNTYYITDDLSRKRYPDNMITGYGTDFQHMPGYDSYGNDITHGSGLTLEQVKQKCLDTPGSGGFYMSGNNYWIKNENMWPKGKRQYKAGDLYVRNKTITNNNSCSKTVDFSYQGKLDGYTNSGDMNDNITCGLGTISKKEMGNIKEQYNKLNTILDTIYEKIAILSKEDVKLNKRLLNEYKRMKNNLSKYENTYKEVKTKNDFGPHFDALEEDSQIQMLSYNQKYILWSILALGITIGAMKVLK
jgi:hypothetical protein